MIPFKIDAFTLGYLKMRCVSFYLSNGSPLENLYEHKAKN